MVNLKRTIAVILSSIALVLGMGLAAAPAAQAHGVHAYVSYSYHYDWRCNQPGITYVGEPYRPRTLTKIWYRTTRIIHSTYYKYYVGYADHVYTEFSHTENTWLYC